MQPTMSDCEVVLLDETSNVAEGDIIAVDIDDKRQYLHRATYVGNDAVQTRGDANKDADPMVDRENVRGEIIFSAPMIGC